ncbi:MAG: hypothetical protein LBB72_06235 [Spirochaetaceae bacterium]|jgi:hypothetical protein|nr:hypothetical protein [Spirochaetaceae bacterium]
MKNILLTSRLLKIALLVIFLLAAGTVFSQTTPGTDKLPQGTPYSEERSDDTEKNSQAKPGSGETSGSKEGSEEFARNGPDDKDAAEDAAENTKTILPAVPAKSKKNTAEQTSPEGPPQWAKDLRRGEIVAFGSLPFTFFFTQTFMDLYRTATHDWDNRYAPSVFKGAGAIPMTDTELKMMFGIAISASVVVAVVDHFIIKHKRSKARVTQQ